MKSDLTESITQKMFLLNVQHKAVIFVLTGPNGSGKTIFAKQLLTELPFHQSFNLGAVAKTIRFAFGDEQVTQLENFTNKKTTNLFTPIVQFSCAEYQKNGVNVIVEGVQIDTASANWKDLIVGGVILEVNDDLRIQRNQLPETHFNRAMELSLTDHMDYPRSAHFKRIDNNADKEHAYLEILQFLDTQLDHRLSKENYFSNRPTIMTLDQ